MRPLFFLSLLAPAFVLASEEGVNPKATDLFEIGGIPVSNSILTTWILTALIIIAIRVLVGSPKIVPSKGQALVENMASGLRDALEPIVGKSMIGTETKHANKISSCNPPWPGNILFSGHPALPPGPSPMQSTLPGDKNM